MFDYLTGEVAARHPTHVVLDVGGIGYRVEVPLSVSRSLPESGSARVWIYGRISEERLELFGFSSASERDLFSLMVDTIPSLGPRRAIRILSEMSCAELVQIVRKGEVDRLKATKGIGDKLASRMVLELRGRLPEMSDSKPETSSVLQEAMMALMSLGFARREAEDAVSRAAQGCGPGARLEELVKRSLAHA